MYKEYYYVKKRRYHLTSFQKYLFVGIFVFLIITAVVLTYFIIVDNKQNKPLNIPSDYLEIIGYEEIELSNIDPYIYLYNLSSNKYKLKYEILNEQYEKLFISDYLYPGEEISLNIIDKLKDYNILTYKISIYDLNDNFLNYLNQKQTIYVKNY